VTTPHFLRERLSVASSSKDRFGATADEVLETAALIAAANSEWDKKTITAFQKEQEIHPKVWGKLVAIARSKNLQSIPRKELPSSYTALYALEVMSTDELAEALKEGLLQRREGQEYISSRAILDWTKAFRLSGSGIEQEIYLTLVLRENLTEESQKDLLSALKETAAGFNAQVLEGKGGVKQSGLKTEARKAKALEIEEDLMSEIGQLVAAAAEDLKTRFGVRSAADLIEAPRQTFTGFFQNLEGKVEGAFWRNHGRAYCLRIARDYNLTNSRAQRYQFKKRIDDAIKNWDGKIDGFRAMAENVLVTYMGR
jgi:hypothetical protein